jgi:hypothetical protein
MYLIGLLADVDYIAAALIPVHLESAASEDAIL